MKRRSDPLILAGTPAEASDVRYASGFVALDAVIYVQVGKRRYMVVPPLELGRARAESGGRVTIFTPDELGLTRAQRRSPAGWAVGLLKTLKLKQVAVSPMCPVVYTDAWRKAGFRVTVSREGLFPSGPRNPRPKCATSQPRRGTPRRLCEPR